MNGMTFVPPETVAAAVGREVGLSAGDILSKCRSKGHVRARWVTLHVYRRLTRAGYADVGRAFEIDHTTVMHAERQLRKALDRDPELAALVDQTEALLRTEAGMVPTYNEAVMTAKRRAISTAKLKHVPLVDCPSNDLMAALGEDFGEQPIATARGSRGERLVITASQTGTWTVVQTMHNGFAEIVFSGTGWFAVPPRPKKREEVKPEPAPEAAEVPDAPPAFPRQDSCMRCHKTFRRTATGHRHCTDCRNFLDAHDCRVDA